MVLRSICTNLIIITFQPPRNVVQCGFGLFRLLKRYFICKRYTDLIWAGGLNIATVSAVSHTNSLVWFFGFFKLHFYFPLMLQQCPLWPCLGTSLKTWSSCKVGPSNSEKKHQSRCFEMCDLTVPPLNPVWLFRRKVYCLKSVSDSNNSFDLGK